MNTRKIVVFLETGFCGSNDVRFYEVDDRVSDEDLDTIIYEDAVENAASHGYYPPEALDGDIDEESISWGIEGWYEEYVPEEHDEYTVTGTPEFIKVIL